MKLLMSKLRWVLHIAIVATFFIFNGITYADESPSITVQASAEVATPVIGAEVNMFIKQRNTSVQAAKQVVDSLSKKLLSRLNNLSIADEDIESYQIRITPYTRREPGTSAMKHEGFDVARQFSIVIRDWSNIDNVLDDAVKLGVNQISQIELLTDDDNELYQQALNLAVEQARNKAKAIAKQAGVKVGAVLRIEESGRGPVLRSNKMMMAESSISRSGTQTINASVIVTYQLEN